jgi:hypothetical protein
VNPVSAVKNVMAVWRFILFLLPFWKLRSGKQIVFPLPFVAASRFSCKQFGHIYVSKLDTAASYRELSGAVNRHAW